MGMKKILGSLLALGLLAGCGNEKVSETPKEEENVAAVEKEEKPVKLSVDIVDEASYTYEDDTELMGNYSAVIENKSDIPVDVSNITVTYENNDGNVIGSSTNSTVWVSPHVIEPGQKAYVMNETDLPIASSDDFKSAEMTVTPKETTEKAIELPIEGALLTADDNSVFLRMLGKVKNTSDTPLDHVTIAAAIYDKNDKFVTVSYGQVQETFNPNQSVPFQTDSPWQNFGKLQEPERYEIFAYMYE